ncbi:MAG: ParA family protein [Candidatus Hodarchaeota archaeon]
MKVLCLHSYKGGTGKTTIAVNMSLEFARHGKRVLLIDSDFRAPSLSHFFPPTRPVPFYFSDFLDTSKEIEFEAISYPSQVKNLFLSYTNPNPRLGEEFLSLDPNWHARALSRFLDKLDELDNMNGNNWDFIILDNTPGLDLPAVNNLLVSDIALLVLQPNIYGVEGTRFLLKAIYSQTKTLKKRKDFLIFNQVPLQAPRETIEKWKQQFAEEFDVKVLIEIGCSCSVIVNSLKENQYSTIEDEFFRASIADLCQDILAE